ncbi:MAG: gamma-glutamyl-gamma-aminobutyrate hydrolase family protein [Erysipelotrichaceae bacterium]|nr:gamma-glutamyl-gamma-aminobutyrate hydrolase family protein [Erysipelotrichaceae bacterium]
MLKIAIPAELENVKDYIRALQELGANYELVFADVDANKYSGLLMPGGGDVDPKYYHQDNNGSYGIDDNLDERQFKVLDKFVKANKPILGICRGHQLINVYFGGTLIQDLNNAKDHVQISKGVDNVNDINALEGSILANLYGANFKSNSSHHQAVDKAGEGLHVSAYCDNVVEALEHESLPIFTIQFHPERMCFDFYKDEIVDGSKIIKYFLDRCHEV